ncbi:MAG TPA: cytidylate kinase-like family protein [Capillimicrobium sp.]|nr:cytidylate kinase-like family protein [Capillimicrobium sp.]
MGAVVTLSACYGAGGSEIGPALAQRLGVPFLDRAIPREVAERLAVPLAEAERRDGSVGSALGRMLRDLAPLGAVFGSPAPAVLPEDEDDFIAATEQVIREHAAGPGAVILERAAAVVLADDPRALHVRLSGPRERRIEQAMRIEGVDRETACRRQQETDRARDAYVRHFYRVDAHDPALYHLSIDSTRLPLECVVALIAAAAETRPPAPAAASGPR